MKAAIYAVNGAPDVLRLVELVDPDPGQGELLIRVEAISIEGGDLLARRSVAPGEPPRIKGYVAAGRVIALGEGVADFAVGGAVTTFAFEGSHAELRAVAANQCWRIPAGVSMAVAAAGLITFGTAALALEQAGLKAGQTVLVTGAGGGVGVAAIQIAAQAGARVIGTGSNPATLAALKPYGLADAIVTGDGAIAEQVRGLLGGGGVDGVIENVGGQSVREGIAALVDGGRIVLVGLIDRDVQRINPVNLLLRRLTVTGCFLGPVIAEPAVSTLIDEALAGIAAGRFVVPIDRCFAFADVVNAHARAEERGRIGRVVMTM